MDDGTSAARSEFDPIETMARFETEVRDRGMTVFARIDHAADANAVGLALRSTLLLVFGDPRVGTKLMQDTQTMGLELPLKALVWKDAMGQTWLACSDPRAAAARQGATAEAAALAATINAILTEIVACATVSQ